MKKLFILVFAFFNVITILRAQIPYPELIEKIKPSVVGIEAHDDTLITFRNGELRQYHSYGSGVLIAIDSINTYALTNEHVIAIKDSNGKTIRYAKDIVVSINMTDIGAFPCKGKIIKVNEELDLVALSATYPSNIKETPLVIVVGHDLWEEESNLKEGEVVLYSGYPLKWGRGEINLPLTRTGIISQLIPGSQTFLIDAFVQPGYSGSPVFLLRSKPNVLPAQWYFKFIGICKAYPYSLSPVYQKVKFAEIPDAYVIENPGFSVVIGISAVKQLFK
ncbi:trypsin-like peptidase domain-containing protein [candidate division KSB1 bacterium]|nr:trypsin-like peptidase domain-containing protein [candidate division KSB1 bacterium]